MNMKINYLFLQQSSTISNLSYFSSNKCFSCLDNIQSPGMDYQIKTNLSINTPFSFLGFSTKIFTSKPNVTLRLLEKYQPESSFNTILYENETNEENYAFDEFTTVKSQSVYDEGYESLGTEIWPIVSQQPRNIHFVWEYFDNPEVKLELPFACEADLKTVPLFQSILKQKCLGLMNCNVDDNNPIIVSHETLVRYIKYMLVGTASVIFMVDERGLFYFKDDITVQDLSMDALKSYCTDLMFCGSCFRSLTQLCATYTSSTAKICGYVFQVIKFLYY